MRRNPRSHATDRRLAIESMEMRLALSTVTGSDADTSQFTLAAHEGGYVQVQGVSILDWLHEMDGGSLGHAPLLIAPSGNHSLIVDGTVEFRGTPGTDRPITNGNSSGIVKIPTVSPAEESAPGGEISLPEVLDPTPWQALPASVEQDEETAVELMVASDPPSDVVADARLTTSIRGRDVAFEVAAWSVDSLHMKLAEELETLPGPGNATPVAPAVESPVIEGRTATERQQREPVAIDFPRPREQELHPEDLSVLTGETPTADEPVIHPAEVTSPEPLVKRSNEEVVPGEVVSSKNAIEHTAREPVEEARQAAFSTWRGDDELLEPNTDERGSRANWYPVLLLAAAGPFATRPPRKSPQAATCQLPPRRRKR